MVDFLKLSLDLHDLTVYWKPYCHIPIFINCVAAVTIVVFVIVVVAAAAVGKPYLGGLLLLLLLLLSNPSYCELRRPIFFHVFSNWSP
uniref:Uncharacterized protein n=1 Tax=Rhizophora mucronata TaxID=61149 RepID=A0A2P2M134_RHIMU